MAATNNLAYRVNHHQRILRPQDPQTLDFQLDLNHVDDGFVRGDIHVQQKRHIVVASDYQMELLCNATRWYLHIIMHIYLHVRAVTIHLTHDSIQCDLLRSLFDLIQLNAVLL